MRWNVNGANEHSGDEVNLAVEATTKDEAAAKARKRGILVHSVTPAAAAADAPPTPTPTKEVTRVPTGRAPDGSLPDYAEITNSARVIEPIGMFISVVGWIVVLAGAGMATYGLTQLNSTQIPAGILLTSGIALAVSGIIYVGLGALLRIAAATAVAVRDIARNSFK